MCHMIFVENFKKFPVNKKDTPFDVSFLGKLCIMKQNVNASVS